MSVDQYQREVNGLDKDIADLESKKSKVDSSYADLQGKITSAFEAVRKTKSATTVKSKMRQIESWTKEADKKSKESAELGKKIADKKKKRNTAYGKLQNAEKQENAKRDKEIKSMKEVYEARIDELTKIKYSVEHNNSVYQENDEIYDVFVSHAWEDKEEFVEEFVSELEKLGIKVWYDKKKIQWGDSMRARIDEGLKHSRFGIAVISPNYLAKEKYWTKAELDGLFQLESVNGKNILPIWHNITKQQILEYSPIIANKKAMSTAMMTVGEIAQELKDLLLDE